MRTRLPDPVTRCFVCGIACRVDGPCLIESSPIAFFAGFSTCARKDTRPAEEDDAA